MGSRSTMQDPIEAAAEALVLLEPRDSETVVELIARFEDVALIFGQAAAGPAHPARIAVDEARRFAQGDGDVARLGDAFMRMRAECERMTAASSAVQDSGANESIDAMPLAADEELLRDFVTRVEEHCDDADECLLALEGDPADAGAVDAVFRTFHTVKGMAGFLALDRISEHAHSAESLLVSARESGGPVESATLSALFEAVGTLRMLISDVADAGETAELGGSDEGLGDTRSADASDEGARDLPSRTAESRRHASTSGGTLVASGKDTVRVDESRLDALLDAIGELVIAESIVSGSLRSGKESSSFDSRVEQLDKITRELQQMATSMRMVTLHTTFLRMKRLVRDLATKAGKRIELLTEGQDAELDKAVVDRIQDPLIHALRNAVDHGIECPEERIALGKPPVGRIVLRAVHRGGAVHIEVCDDGRGIEGERVIQSARALGLLVEGAEPSPADVSELLFLPGFTTARTVTEVSGRGVGMDAVRRAVEGLRGRVELRSEAGRGTTLFIRLPVTLAIIDGMVVRVGAERYILPMLAIERSVCPKRDQVSTVAGRGEMLALDDGMIPLIRLHRFFSAENANTSVEDGIVVIVNDEDVRVGLLVCELLGQQQAVIKSLGNALPDVAGIAGGAIMPDGRVGFILDAAGLVQTVHVKGH